MKKLYLFTALVILFTISANAQALIVDWGFSGVPKQTLVYDLKAGQTYNVVSSSTNFCATSSFKWTVYPSKGYTLSNPNIEEPSMSFTIPGAYTVTLEIKTFNAPGFTCGTQTVTRTYTIRIPYTKPVARISPSATTVNAGSSIKFTDNSTNYPTSWQWTVSPASGWGFSSGGSGSQSPSVKFTAPGQYSVMLNASNPAGSSTSAAVNIKVNPGPPTASFKANSSSANQIVVTPNSTVSLRDFSTGNPTAWAWTITPASGWSYVSGSSTSANPDVRFTATGFYSISLKVSNSAGSHTVTKSNYISVAPSAPTVTSPVTYCMGATAAKLTASGSNLKWYNAFSGGTGSATAPVPATDVAKTTTYYVSQTVNSLESPRKAISVVVNSLPPAPSVTSTVWYCQGTTAAALTATGSGLKWYTSVNGTPSSAAPVPSTAALGAKTYYVSQTNNNGCEGPRSQVNVVVSATPQPPIVVSPQVFCTGSPTGPLTATGTALKWYTVPTGGVGSSTAPVPSTSIAGTKKYYVSQTLADCGESPRAEIVITVSPVAAPAAPVVNATINLQQNSATTALTAVGTGLKWYTEASGGTPLPAAPVPSTFAAGSTSYYVAQTNDNGCEGPRAEISVTVIGVDPTKFPDWAWAQKSTGTPAFNTSFDRGRNIAIDAFNNTYVTGYFTNTVTFGSYVLKGADTRSTGYLVKYNPKGDIIWAKTINTGYSLIPNAITVANDGSINITGVFTGTVYIGSTSLSATSFGDMFVAKFNNNGEALWALRYGANMGAESGHGIITDASGNIFITGFVTTPVSFDDYRTYEFPQSVAVVKFTGEGKLVWEKSFRNEDATSYHNTNRGYGIGLDAFGNCYITGQQLHSQFFIAKYDTAGEQVWLRNSVTSKITGRAAGYAIVTDAEGNSFVTGSYNDTTNFDGIDLPGSNSNDIFVARYDSEGQLMWVKKAGGDNNDEAMDVATDANGNVLITGSFQRSAKFDSVTVSNEANLYSDVFVAKYDADGGLLWADKAAGTRYCKGLGVVLDAFGNAYISGYYGTGITFGNASLTGTATTNFFLARLGITERLTPLPNPPVVVSPVNLQQNDTPGALTATGTNLKWYTTATDGTPLPAAPVPSTTNVRNTKYYVSQSNAFGDESERAEINVIVTGRTIQANPPEWIWAKTASTHVPSWAFVRDKHNLGTDAEGNSYIGGLFNTSVTFGSITLTGASNVMCGYIAKYDSNGGVIWARKTADMADYFQIRYTSVKTDAHGNYYATGSFSGSVIMGSTKLTSNAGNIFLVKYNAAGQTLWLKQISGEATGIAIDGTGNIFITGYVITAQSENGSNLAKVLLIKYSPSGQLLWDKSFREDVYNSVTQGNTGKSLSVDKAGNCYLTGTHAGRFFIARYNAAGDRMWMKTNLGGTVSVAGLAVDADGNSYLTGIFSGSPALEDIVLNPVNPSISYNAFIAKYDNSGQIQWAQLAGNDSNSSGVRATAVNIDTAGNSFITGYFGLSATFGNTTLTTPQNGQHLYIAKYTSTGNALWAKKATGGGQDSGEDIALDSQGNVYLYGTYVNALTFDDTMLPNAADGNFFLAKMGASKELSPSVITFAADEGLTARYGDADLSPGATSTNKVTPITYASSDTTKAIIVNNKIRILYPGEVTITARQAGNDDFADAEPVSRTLNIKKAILTITADDKSKTYSDNNPALTISYSGFVNGDTISSLDKLPKATTAATLTSPAGTYPITVNDAVSDKYGFKYVQGVLKIVAFPAVTYGYPDFNPKPTVPGIKYTSSNPAVATIVNGKIHLKGAGTSTITATVGGIVFSQVLTVNKAVLTVTANNVSKTYSENNPALTLKYSGFINGDTPASLTRQPMATTTASITSPAGTYPVNVSGGESANYTFKYVPGSLTVKPYPSITYGMPDFNPKPGIPGIIYTSSNTNVVTIVAGKLHVKNAGTSTITAKVGSLVFSQELTVKKANLIIKANNQSKTAGAANPPLTVTYTGFVYGDNASSLTTQPVVVTTASAGSPAGTYPITAGGALSNNYNITYQPGTMTVNTATMNSLQTNSLANNQPGPVVSKALSPNGDGINDYLHITGIEAFPENKLSVINSKGTTVFDTENYNNNDRIFSGQALPQGTYFYLLQYDDGTKTKSGYFILKY